MIYHAVGNYDLRTDPSTQRNIKSTHIYLPLIDRLKAEGYPVELFFAKDIPNKEVRFYQAQADIVVDMLTFGWFGASVREAMMLGKPAVCYLQPERLESMRREIPDYVDELPVVSATPDTIYDVLKDLITHPEKRQEIGRRSCEFALKWHSAQAGAKRLDRIYCDLMRGKQ
jgi:glycosyltransferase involved in cell wall biosynthesis